MSDLQSDLFDKKVSKIFANLFKVIQFVLNYFNYEILYKLKKSFSSPIMCIYNFTII
jgi:hypothetical protein